MSEHQYNIVGNPCPDLLPCPLCGQPPRRVVHPAGHMVHCFRCLLALGPFGMWLGGGMAQETWNRRQAPGEDA